MSACHAFRSLNSQVQNRRQVSDTTARPSIPKSTARLQASPPLAVLFSGPFWIAHHVSGCHTMPVHPSALENPTACLNSQHKPRQLIRLQV